MNRDDVQALFRAHPDKSQTGLSKALGKDPSAANKILKGVRGIKAGEVSTILKYFEEGPPGLAEAPAAFEGPEFPARTEMPRDMPVYGIGACGDEQGSFEMNMGQAIDYVRRPPRLRGVADSYALYASGDSMKPWREHGQLVFVHRKLPVRVQDHVVVLLVGRPGDPQKALIKRLVRRTEKDLRLEQYNPPGEITLPMRSVLEIHRVLDIDDIFGV